MNGVINSVPGFETAALTVAELFVVLFLLVYTVFSLVIIKQVNLMIQTLKVGLDTPIRFFAYAHLFISVSVLIFSFFILLS